MAGKLQNADFKSLGELTGLGATNQSLLNTDKIYTSKSNDVLENTLRKNNFAGAVDPDVDDDSSENYEVGSVWINTVDEKVWFCFDNSVGAAIWKEAGGGGTGTGSGGINFIENSQFEEDTSTWFTYANTTPSSVPDDFGGTPQSGLSIIHRKDLPAYYLRGTGAAQLVSSTNNHYGSGWYTQFLIDEMALQNGGPIECLVDYRNTPTFTFQKIKPFIISSSDNFVADFNIITISDDTIVDGDFLTHRFTFTPDTNRDYRLCFHVIENTITTETITIDNIIVRPVENTSSGHLIYADSNAVSDGDGTISSPFKSLQDAVNNIVTTERYTIIIASGSTFDEDVTINYDATVTLLGLGPWTLGDAAGFNFSSTTPRNLTLNQFAGTNTYSGVNITALDAPTYERGTSTDYISGTIISGDIIVNDNTLGWAQLELSGVTVEGDISYPSTTSVFKLYVANCRLNTITGPDIIMESAKNTIFLGLTSIQNYCKVTECYFQGGLTLVSGPTAAVHPSGIFHSEINGTVNGPANCLLVDGSTYKTIINNSVTLAGGATIEYNEYEPLGGPYSLISQINSDDIGTTGWTNTGLSFSVVASSLIDGNNYYQLQCFSGVGSVGDNLVSQPIELEGRQNNRYMSCRVTCGGVIGGSTANTLGMILQYSTDGVAYSDTGNFVYPFAAKTDYICAGFIPNNATHVRVKFEKLLDATAGIQFDAFEFSTDPFKIIQIDNETGVGEVIMYASDTLPNGFLNCDGTAVSRAVYADLFAIIGTTFGVGDGSTTFNLPDLENEFIRGADATRTVGTTEADQFEDHTHWKTDGHDTIYAIDASNSGTRNLTTGPYEMVIDTYTGEAATGTRGTETRPQNVALKFCIRYMPKTMKAYATPATVTLETGRMEGFFQRNISNLIEFNLVKEFVDGDLLKLENGDHTRFTFKKRCKFYAHVSADCAASVTTGYLKWNNISDVEKANSLNSGPQRYRTSSLSGTAEAGDYLVFFSTVDLSNNNFTNFSVTAIPEEITFLAAVPVPHVAYIDAYVGSRVYDQISSSTTYKTRAIAAKSGEDWFITTFDTGTDRFTLAPGKYDFEVEFGAYSTCNGVDLLLYNVTDAATEVVHPQGPFSASGTIISWYTSRFTIEISSPKTFEFQTKAAVAGGLEMMGRTKITRRVDS